MFESDRGYKIIIFEYLFVWVGSVPAMTDFFAILFFIDKNNLHSFNKKEKRTYKKNLSRVSLERYGQELNFC
jgi:phosphotransferase system  glucose/maltose/N-acetylglucosamine-specific IIC component